MRRWMQCCLWGLLLVAWAGSARAQVSYSWRYYRTGNTGIQGDYNEAVWVAPDGDPYIGGYSPSFEEGGFAKFLQSEDRWVNFSNVDHPVIGSPNEVGCTRVTDFVAEPGGKVWAATWRGALRFDPAVGPDSLERFGPANSKLANDMTWDADLAPDGSVWFANQGIVRYDPATGAWKRWDLGNVTVAAQPKPGGGYLVWSASTPPIQDATFVFDSDTKQWTTLVPTGAAGEVVGMPGKDCVDDSGNFWAIRSGAPGDWNSLDYRRPDGTWVAPPEPYASLSFYVWAFKAYGDRQAIAVDGSGEVFQFDGTSWSSLGVWRPGEFTYSIDVDAAGNVWVCGIEGAARHDAITGKWQRYRVTNTGDCGNFNGDLALDDANGFVYTNANAAAGIGGMTRFDGLRWVSWNNSTYGLGYDWPFPNDDCHALCHRPSNGHLAVSPTDWIHGIHEWTGAAFQPVPGLGGAEALCEDSLGRLWALGDYFSLNYNDGSAWHALPITGSGLKLRQDPTKPGTVWATTDYEIQRTDGSTTFSRTIGDFPGAGAWFTGLAPDKDGIVWVGTWSQFTSTGATLIRLDADTGAYTMFEHDAGWPFPGEHVRPLAVTPDGRLWLHYDSEFPSNDSGLCWYDGVHVGSFPAPPGGAPQWGGLPNAIIDDLEVRPVAGGYELWISCLSRGIAVLTVLETPTWTDLGEGLAGVVGLPVLAGTGTLEAGSSGGLSLADAKASAAAMLFVSVASTPVPFKGGTLVPVPVALSLGLVTDGAGAIALPFTWPTGVPSATSLYFQFAIQDPVGPHGASLSNALKAITP